MREDDMAEMSQQVFEMLQKTLERIESGQRDIQDSVRVIERKASELEINAVRQQESMREQVRRTDALEQLVTEVRAESKESVKTLREEMEKRLKPAIDMHDKLTGFWTVTKWVAGIMTMAGGVFGAWNAITRFIGH